MTLLLTTDVPPFSKSLYAVREIPSLCATSSWVKFRFCKSAFLQS